MGKGKTVTLALFTAAIWFGHDTALADKGGRGPNAATAPSVNLGLGAIPNMTNSVGLATEPRTPPGATQSASSAGLAPPGQIKKNASLVGAANREARLDDLPTCR